MMSYVSTLCALSLSAWFFLSHGAVLQSTFTGEPGRSYGHAWRRLRGAATKVSLGSLVSYLPIGLWSQVLCIMGILSLNILVAVCFGCHAKQTVVYPAWL